MLRNLKEEAQTLTKWLVSIPSVSLTRGESIAIRAIYDGLLEFPYYREHPDSLHYVGHEDQQNSSLVAFLKAHDHTPDTLIILGHVDTSGTESYGSLKGCAHKEDELRSKLKNLKLKREVADDLDSTDTLFGLGVFECKAVTGSIIAMIREFSDNPAVLDFNLVFVILSRSLYDHEGIKAVEAYLEPLFKAEELNPILALSFIPEPVVKGHPELHLYSAMLGMVEPSFFVLGMGTDSATPFDGFSPTLIASLIIKKLELNPGPLRSLSQNVLIPSFAHIFSRNQNASATPDAVQISFNLPFLHLDLSELTQRLKEIAAEAIEECSELCDERESLYNHLNGRNFIPDIKDAEVISYQDLFDRAELNYRGNLNAAITALLEKCRMEGLSYREMCFCIIERLNELSRLPRPSVVVFLGHTFIPCAQLSLSDRKDREIIMCLEKTAVKLGQITGFRPAIAKACKSSDANFLRPLGTDNALKVLSAECPVSDFSFTNFSCPAVTLGVPGYDLGSPTERVRVEALEYICTFIPAMMDSLAVLNRINRETESVIENANSDKNQDPFKDPKTETVPESVPEPDTRLPDTAAKPLEQTVPLSQPQNKTEKTVKTEVPLPNNKVLKTAAREKSIPNPASPSLLLQKAAELKATVTNDAKRDDNSRSKKEASPKETAGSARAQSVLADKAGNADKAGKPQQKTALTAESKEGNLKAGISESPNLIAARTPFGRSTASASLQTASGSTTEITETAKSNKDPGHS